jgi:hypothetical protein
METVHQRKVAARARQGAAARPQSQSTAFAQGCFQVRSDLGALEKQSSPQTLRSANRQRYGATSGATYHRSADRCSDSRHLEKEGGVRADQALPDRSGVNVALSSVVSQLVFLSDGASKISRSSLHRLPGPFTQKEGPNNRLDLLGASARAMASQAPLGGWCPPLREARFIETTSCEKAPASPHIDTSSATRHLAWACLGPQRHAKTVSQPSVARREGWSGRALSLTTAPLGPSRREAGRCEREESAFFDWRDPERPIKKYFSGARAEARRVGCRAGCRPGESK